MKPNRALIALQVIAISAIALGGVIWLIGTSQVNSQINDQGLDPSFVGATDAGARVAIGLALLQIGLVVGLAWLVAASIVFAISQALERLAPQATEAATVEAQEKSRASAVANGTLLDRVRAELND